MRAFGACPRQSQIVARPPFHLRERARSVANTERCPICNVAVKPENLPRHLNDIHPRHPDMPRFRDELKAELGRNAPRNAARPFRIRKIHVAVVLVIVLIGVGAYYVSFLVNRLGTRCSPTVAPKVSSC